MEPQRQPYNLVLMSRLPIRRSRLPNGIGFRLPWTPVLSYVRNLNGQGN